jgi:nucleotidyltransferase substrate binding protein (TIGR01987 family)
MIEDIRWKQRLQNYEKALSHLTAAVDYAKVHECTTIVQLSVVKAFELTFELAWNVMKDYLTGMGITGIIGSKGAVRQAFKDGLISNGPLWMDMIDDRNLATHTYNEETAELLVQKILTQYASELESFAETMGKL